MSIQSRQGYALPLIVLVLLVGSIGAMAAASVAGQQARFPRLLDSSIRAIHAAESGAAFVVNSFARQDLAWPADGNYCDDGVGCDASLAALPGVPTASSPAAHGMDQWWVDSLQVNGTSMSIWIRGVDASGRATRQIQVEYQQGDPRPTSVFSTAVVGCSGVNLNGSGRIDSYDSSEGPYDPATAGAEANVSTLWGDVVLSGNSPIMGGLHVGGNLTLSGSATIAGTIQATGNVNFTGNPSCPTNSVLAGGSITAPGSWWCSGSRHHFQAGADVPPPPGTCDPLNVNEYVDGQLADARTRGSLRSGNFSGWQPTPIEIDRNVNFTSGFSVGASNTVNFHSEDVSEVFVGGNFSVGGGSTVAFRAPSTPGNGGRVRLFIDGDLNMGGGASFIIERGIALEIYVTGRVNMGGGLRNLNESPTITIIENGQPVSLPSFAIYSSFEGTNGVNIGGDSQIFASVYAPHADVRVDGAGGLYGAVRGRSVDVRGAGGIHYDLSLGETGVITESDTFTSQVTRWLETT